jgi:uroporphyrinogen-III synthase
MTHVLLTRPLTASQQLAGQLDDLGLTPIVMPFYTFTARDPGFNLATHWSGRARNLAVFTSPRAVEYGLPHIAAEAATMLEFAVVGSATRRALEKSGRQVHIQAGSGYTSEDLLQQPELREHPGEAVIFCAPGGRQTLAEGLEALGWSVTLAMVYERVSLSPSRAQLNELESAGTLLSVWTSVAAIDLAREALAEELWGKIISSPVVVISGRIQQHLEHLGAARIELTDGPGNPDIYEAVARLVTEQADY